MDDTEFDELKTRHSLLARLQDWQDDQSWQEFFDKYWRLIFNLARRAGLRPDEAEDVVQNVVVSMAKKITEFRCDPKAGSFRAYLQRLVRWRVNDRFRRRAAHESWESSGDATGDTELIERVADEGSSDFDQIWDEEWRQNLLNMAFDRLRQRLDPKQVEIFELYVLKEWPVDRVREALGVSANQIYLAKHRIRSALADDMKELDERMW